MRNRIRIGDTTASGTSLRRRFAAFVGSLLLYCTPVLANVDATLEPHDIALGDAAELTIKISGIAGQSINMPSVPGLQFRIIGQSRSLQMTNGVTLSSVSTIVRVVAESPGTYIIPGLTPPSQPLVLHVRPPGTPPATPSPGASGGGPNTSGPNGVRMSADGAAFVRLALPKHDVYVGESVPVDIEVGMRAGFVTSLNGLPTFKGGDFTLNNLSHQPERVERMVDGKPFEVLIWHSVLAAVKPGEFSLSVETPLTVRVRTQSQRESRLDDLLGDPFLQNFFGPTVQKEVTVSSPSTEFKVLALPAEGRPADFSGAIGTFKIANELSSRKGMAGDPLTLKMRVSGTGNFDRVNSAMLDDVDGWKTYPPKSNFTAGDAIGYKGEKTFEQPVIPALSGTQTLPALSFSYFNPTTRKYETARGEPLSVEITGAGPAATAATAGLSGKDTPPPASPQLQAALHADHSTSTTTAGTLMPLYLRPGYLAFAGAVCLAFAGVWLASWRTAAARSRRARQTRSTDELLQHIKSTAAARDAPAFLSAVRAALVEILAARWMLDAQTLTPADIDARLSDDDMALRRIFALADEANYSGYAPGNIDFAGITEAVHAAMRNDAPAAKERA